MVYERLELAAYARNLTLIYDALDRFQAAATAVKGVAVTTVFDAFKTAVIEIATNILRHAYPPAKAPGNSPDSAPDNATHSPAPLTVELSLFAQRLEAVFHDQGIAFTPFLTAVAPSLDEIDDILDVPEGNFGLFLALQALDHLDYSRTPDGVNQWKLMKQLS